MKFLIVADIHGNYYALASVMKAVKFDVLLCCGDLVVDYPFPEQCIQALRATRGHICLGNNDDNVAYGRKTSAYLGERYAHLARDLDRATDLTAQLISAESRKYLMELPRECRFVLDGVSFYMNHTVPAMPLHHYLDANASTSELASYYKAIDADVMITGHTHTPYVKKLRDKILVNPGSVGEPRDGDARASFATFDSVTGRIELGRLEYDITETSDVLRQLNFPYYALFCLENGFLPNKPTRA
jgi:putative phosphoesterase